MKKIIFLLLLLLALPVLAGDRVYEKNGIAASGYDVVAYFMQSAAVKGDAQYAHGWKDAVWHFSSKENRDVFASEPQRYAPQYGGFCAFAMSKGSLAPTDPRAWTIYKDKLYLNYSLDVRTHWKQDLDKNILLADRHWARLAK